MEKKLLRYRRYVEFRDEWFRYLNRTQISWFSLHAQIVHVLVVYKIGYLYEILYSLYTILNNF